MRSVLRRAAAAVAIVTAPAFLVVACTTATATPRPTVAAHVTTTSLPGDDNRDGIIHEEESGWNCRTMGNHRCGKRALLAVRACTDKTVMTGRGARRHAVRLTPVPASLMPACLKLGSRPARTVRNPDGSRYSDPAGPVLVLECRNQGLTQVELKYCLTQP